MSYKGYYKLSIGRPEVLWTKQSELINWSRGLSQLLGMACLLGKVIHCLQSLTESIIEYIFN